MTVSSQIIEIINDLCAKFGVVIDWSTENILPALQTLAEKFIRWEIATSTAWIVISAIIVVAIICVIIAGFKKRWDYDFVVPFTIFGSIVAAIFVIVICFQVFDIIEAHIFPEKTIFEYIEMMIPNG